MPDFYRSHRPPPGGSRSLTETLLLTTTSATTRTQEATLMFGNVASAINEAARGTNYHTLPHHLKGTYEKFLYCLQEVAQGFFESHVRGVPQDERTPLKPTQPTTSTAHRSTKPPLIPKTTRPTYAHAAAQMKSQNITRKPIHPNRSQKPNSSPSVDERLFLRLEQDATERLISPYPLLLQLRKFLGENAALLKEVQHVPSGLALRPSSDTASPRLESLFSEGIKEGRLRGALGIEKAQNLVTFLLSSIPRSYTALNDANELTNFPITAENVCSELKEEKGLTPVAAFETRTSLDSPHSYTARYIVRFPLDTILPQKFQLFGVEVISRRLSNKVSIVQCGRCFQWHNERICSRALRCRLCGSTEHIEENHSPCGPHPHPCPARCIHCHGPHAADATECPLRPRRNGNRLTKEQVAHIRQSSAAARMSLCTTVGCTRRSPRTPPVDHEMPDATSMPNFGSANPPSETSACTDVVPSGSSQLTVIPATYSPVHTGNPYSPLDETNEL